MKPTSVIANSSLAVTDDPDLTADGTPAQPQVYAMRLWRLGRRINRKNDTLLTLGHLTFQLTLEHTPLTRHTNERRKLNLKDAILRRTLTYHQDIELQETTFVDRNQPIVALQRTVTNHGNTTAHLTADFIYTFDQAAHAPRKIPRGLSLKLIHTGVSNALYEYQADTIRPADGILSLKTTVPNVRPQVRDNTITFHFSLPLAPKTNRTLNFFVFPCDQIDADNYMAMAYQIKNSLRMQAFQNLYEEHLIAWHQRWERLNLILPEHRLVTVYRAALYHLLCTTQTATGIPDGLTGHHNQARYNALNELFAVDALLNAGFSQQAKQPSAFRRKTMNQANTRPGNDCQEANFPLWTDETGAPAGPAQTWPATCLAHNAHIALAAWHAAQFTHDKNFLRQDAYPILRAVAQFFVQAATTAHHTPSHRTDDGLAIVPCRDFPGAAPYTTTPVGTAYAVADTLEAATQAALDLDTDDTLRTTWSSHARKLLETQMAERQTEQPDGTDTLSLLPRLAYLFPYGQKPSISPENLKKLQDLAQNPLQCPGPDGTPPPCPWTAAWIAALAARLKLPDLAEQALLATAQTADATGQIPQRVDLRNHTSILPWFMPAQATYVIALTLMLIQSDSTEIQLMPATPHHWKDLDATLPASGGLLVTFKLRNLSLTKLSIANQTDDHMRRIITLPPHITLPHPLNPTQSYSLPPRQTIRII